MINVKQLKKCTFNASLSVGLILGSKYCIGFDKYSCILLGFIHNRLNMMSGYIQYLKDHFE